MGGPGETRVPRTTTPGRHLSALPDHRPRSAILFPQASWEVVWGFSEFGVVWFVYLNTFYTEGEAGAHHPKIKSRILFRLRPGAGGRCIFIFPFVSMVQEGREPRGQRRHPFPSKREQCFPSAPPKETGPTPAKNSSKCVAQCRHSVNIGETYE